jgi:hypothetical protein
MVMETAAFQLCVQMYGRAAQAIHSLGLMIKQVNGELA